MKIDTIFSKYKNILTVFHQGVEFIAENTNRENRIKIGLSE